MNNTPQTRLTRILTELAGGYKTGYTVWFDFKPRSSGYVVGNGKKGLLFEQHAWMDNIDALAAHLVSVVGNWEAKDYDGYGFWVDDNKLYIDPIVHIEDRTQAVLMGMAHGELAIWDLGRHNTIDMANFELTERNTSC